MSKVQEIKVHGRSKFSFKQSEYIAEKLRALLPKKANMTTKSLKKFLLATANEYVRSYQDGNHIRQIGNTTVYDFLRRHGIAAPNKSKAPMMAKETPEEELNVDSDGESTSLDTQSTISADYEPLSVERIRQQLAYHEEEIRKIMLKLKGFEDTAVSIDMNSDNSDDFIKYNQDQEFHFNDDEIKLNKLSHFKQRILQGF